MSLIERLVILHNVLVQKLQSHGREPCLRTSEPSSAPCLGTSVLSPGRSLKGGRPAIVAATSYTSSDALRRPFFTLPG
ncbi:hypothetical protein CsSME_00020392 [Camellia sinensis var. sinensis]